MDALILCGGLGTRFQEVSRTIPKILAPVDDKNTFLDILLTKLTLAGVHRVILCIGHLGGQIEEYCKGRYEVEFSREKTPLGTGGAIRNALPLVESDPFLVLNGDSLCGVSLSKLISYHISNQSLITLTLVEVPDAVDYGSVKLAKDNKVLEFVEKRAGTGFINTGIYCVSKRVADYMPTGKFSLERDLLPTICDRCYGFVVDSSMLDIGTAERYQKVKRLQAYSLV